MPSTRSNPWPKPLSAGFFLTLAASASLFWVWYDHYLTIEFNELGRYYDPDTQTVYTDSAYAWILPALGFLLAACIKLLRNHPRP
jgi:hypothetical protein